MGGFFSAPSVPAPPPPPPPLPEAVDLDKEAREARIKALIRRRRGRAGLEEAGGALTPEQVDAANRHLETMAKFESEDARETLRVVNASLRAEAGSEDAYVRRMRPTFDYVMAATWAAQMGAVAWIVVRAPGEAAAVIEALGALSVVWSVGLSVLGVYVYKRSSEKAMAAGSPQPGLRDRLQRVAEGR